MVSEARRSVPQVSPTDSASIPGAAFVDVREPHEVGRGHISDALLIPRGVLESEISASIPDPDTPIVVYCAVGERSALAAVTLVELGYSNVVNMVGGFDLWQHMGLDWVNPSTLSAEQLDRYSRHTILPEVGVAGQAKLLASKVAIVGAGGLGSPVAMYLAAAGVGVLGVIDDDVVEASNLQRQIMHGGDSVGIPKTASAATTLTNLNTDVEVVEHPIRLDASNAVSILSKYDLIVDCTDNFPTRYLVNDVSVMLGIPVVHASIFRFEGQVSVFGPDGPCYRCLFPLPPPPELAPNCAEAGVLGVLPGIVGSLQAMEAIKLLLGLGESLSGRLLLYDALDQEFQTLRISKNPACRTCSNEATIHLVDYDDSCVVLSPR